MRHERIELAQEILLISAGMKRAAYIANRVSNEAARRIEEYRKSWIMESINSFKRKDSERHLV